MSKVNRLPSEHVNWFDGQRVTESDMDFEQAYAKKIVSEFTLDAIGSGIIDPTPFARKVLLNTASPKITNPSRTDILSENYDGKAIFLDEQVSDSTYGNRIEIELSESQVGGRETIQVIFVGKVFNGTGSSGILNLEQFEFKSNSKKISNFYYQNLIAVLFKNFSGGSGQAYIGGEQSHLNLGGVVVIREAEPFTVWPAAVIASEFESPNHFLATFITSDPDKTIQDEIAEAISGSNSVDSLYMDLDGINEFKFAKNASTSLSCGQKFLSSTNNLQKIELLLSIEKNDSAALGEEYGWSGDLVVSIHALASEADNSSAVVPDDMIDFDPDINSIAEASYDKADLEVLGFKIGAEQKIVSFSFSSTQIADPNSGLIESNKYYAIKVSRKGNNSIGNILVAMGNSKVDGKNAAGVSLTLTETYSNPTTKFFQFDPVYKRYVADSTKTLWFSIHSETLQIVDGSAYSTDGVCITLPKTKDFVGSTQISSFYNNLSLKTISFGESNYVVMNNSSEFFSSGVHPRTHSFVFKKIRDTASFSVITDTQVDHISDDAPPLILARVQDKNTRDAQTITGSFSSPGFVDINKVIIKSPSSTLLEANLIGRVIAPNSDKKYRIIKTQCDSFLSGDLDHDGHITSADLTSLLSIAGNTINSSTTERAILSGNLDVVDFYLSDLNGDKSVDGEDIELIEDAIDGYSNFSASESQQYLTLYLENILEENDYPEILTSATAETLTETAKITLIVSEGEALTLRSGDAIEITLGEDSGSYIILSKIISSDNVTITLTVSKSDGDTPSFVGEAGLSLTITSGTKTNLYADDVAFVRIPFIAHDYELSLLESTFSEEDIKICDLRRFVNSSFIEKFTPSCICDDATSCEPSEECAPVYRNQSLLTGDLYLLAGELKRSPTEMYSVDYEYANIKITIPPGTIDDCSIDLYNTFVKSDEGKCQTAAGYPAMKFADGTYVGCFDSGTSTDVTKGKVRFEHGIAGLHVDSLVDGYAVDGYADTTETDGVNEVLAENYTQAIYHSFDSWNTDSDSNLSIFSISNDAGDIEPLIISLQTSADEDENFAKLLSTDTITGDFIIDITATRPVWPILTLASGHVTAHILLRILNSDNTADLEIGWEMFAGSRPSLYFKGTITNTDDVVINTFKYTKLAPDAIGDKVIFRLRRNDDVVKAYYFLPDKQDATELSNYSGFVRLGKNPTKQPGNGSARIGFVMSQDDTPNAGIAYTSKVSKVDLMYALAADDSPDSILISRSDTTSEVNRATLTFPLSLTSKTSIVSAYLKLTSKITDDIIGSFVITPLDTLNANNIATGHNIPISQSSSESISFRPKQLVIGHELLIDVSQLIVQFLNKTGHLPGFYKGFVIEPDEDTNASIQFSTDAILEINYEDVSTGVIFKIGATINSAGILTLNTKNVLYDASIPENRTVLNIGVHLKKAGFANENIEAGIADLKRIGIGTCADVTVNTENDECFFVTGDSSTGTFVEGPFDCNFSLP